MVFNTWTGDTGHVLVNHRGGQTRALQLEWRGVAMVPPGRNNRMARHMTLREFWRREFHVALHAQSRRFRAVKWAIILLVGASLYLWKGPGVVVMALATSGILGVCLHFFFRWKTDGWTRSWGLYKRIPLDGE